MGSHDELESHDMDGGLFFARTGLALVFGVAASAKLADRTAWSDAVLAFGVPRRLTPLVAAAVPALEVAAAVLLIIPAATIAGATVGAVLLLAFTVGIAVNLALGRTPECHCFGGSSPSPIGPQTLLRNTLLLGAASYTIWGAADPTRALSPAWVVALSDHPLRALAVGVGVAAALAGVAMVQQRRKDAALSSDSPAGLPIGSQAPDFTLSTLEGSPFSLAGSRDAGKYVVLVFASAGCGPCIRLMPQLVWWNRDFGRDVSLAVLMAGPEKAIRDVVGDHELPPVVVDDERISASYEARSTPSAVVVTPEGTIGSAVVTGSQSIEAMVRAAAAGSLPAPNGSGSSFEPRSGIRIGEPVPDIDVRHLDGTRVRFRSLIAGPTVVLFWSPTNDICKRLLPELRSREARTDEPSLLVVSVDGAEQSRDLRIASAAVVDEAGALLSAFGSPWIPSGVLVNPDGRAASAVAPAASFFKLLTSLSGT